MSSITQDALLSEQIAYYRARATEYDEWFLRLGRFDQGEELNRQWFAEVGQLKRALERFAPVGRVLEFAGGTGWWTQELARYAETLTVVDGAPETIAVNKARLAAGAPGCAVRYVEADIFAWQPDARYDVVFFSFWLSHVPPERFDAFWSLVRSCLAPGGRVFFIDSQYVQAGTAADQPLPAEQEIIMERRLNDGRTFRVVKVFYSAEELQSRLAGLGWQAEVQTTSAFFCYGQAKAEG
jgi:ubiquinone/menaquinone biosynthesis C-methylase UbiE